MNYLKISRADVANGPGVRCVLWVSGCDIHCPGCHNPESWCFEAGEAFTESAYQEMHEILSRPFIDGCTISGGHPLAPVNRKMVLKIVKRLREDFPNKTIWLYTGYELDEYDVLSDSDEIIPQIVRLCDVVVDGPYIAKQRNIALEFRGSKNQRLIDVKESREKGRIIQWRKKKQWQLVISKFMTSRSQ